MSLAPHNDSARGPVLAGGLFFRELGADVDDRERLDAFYTTVYEPQFPDPDERESLANIASYLARKAQGWYGQNGYHVVLAYTGDEVVGGCILDYFAAADAGVIEFLFTVPAARCRGIGRALLSEAERLARADAQRAGRSLQWIVAEMNDPFVLATVPDNMDPFVRARIWDHWQFGALDCPYVQPALSDDAKPVGALVLVARLFNPALREGIPVSLVRSLVADYFRLAMRIEEPDANPEFAALSRWLASRSHVRWTPLARYIGEGKSFDIHEVRDVQEMQFAAAMDVYGRAFNAPSTAVEPAAFLRTLRRDAESGYRYHLWAVEARDTRQVLGMASFFSFARMGFGGYVVLEGSLKGAGCLRPLLARMEQQMVNDALDVAGWLIECETASVAEAFRRVGFYALDIDYVQPSLPGARGQAEKPLILMYKRLGRVYGAPVLTASEFLDGLAEAFRYVYGITAPTAHPLWRALATAVGTRCVPVFEGPMSELSGTGRRSRASG